MENSIRINSNKLPIRDYNGQRVVTFKDIDTVHERKDGTAKRNFYTNKERFVEGVDFLKITAYEFRTLFGGLDERRQMDIILVTESGYLMLAKSFTDDLAWKVQRELVNNYFRGKAPKPEQPALETSEYYYFPKTFKGEPVITIADFEYFTGIQRHNIYKPLKTQCKLGEEYFSLSSAGIAQYKRENPSVSRLQSVALVLKESAVRKLLKYFKLSAKIPMIEDKKQPSAKVREPSGFARPSSAMESLMGYIQREARAIEGIANMLLCPDTKENYESYRKFLIWRIKDLRDYCPDIEIIKI